MQKIFLYRLFKESKLFFVFAIVFIFCYCMALRKEMDMLVFPLNSMFSNNVTTDFTSITYAVKLNQNIVPITQDWYVKKDFSENSLQQFSKWIKADGNDIISALINKKIKDSTKKIFYLTRLTPPKTTITTWPVWFLHFHNVQVNKADKIEIWEYKFEVLNHQFVLKDSLLINSQIINE